MIDKKLEKMKLELNLLIHQKKKEDSAAAENIEEEDILMIEIEIENIEIEVTQEIEEKLEVFILFLNIL
jgi:hypothetical protein